MEFWNVTRLMVLQKQFATPPTPRPQYGSLVLYSMEGGDGDVLQFGVEMVWVASAVAAQSKRTPGSVDARPLRTVPRAARGVES